MCARSFLDAVCGAGGSMGDTVARRLPFMPCPRCVLPCHHGCSAFAWLPVFADPAVHQVDGVMSLGRLRIALAPGRHPKGSIALLLEEGGSHRVGIQRTVVPEVVGPGPPPQCPRGCVPASSCLRVGKAPSSSTSIPKRVSSARPHLSAARQRQRPVAGFGPG